MSSNIEKKFSFKILLILLFFINLYPIFSKDISRTKSVRISLQSKWPQNPIYLEVAEFLSDENSDYYWRFIENLGTHLSSSKRKNLSDLSLKEQYELSLTLASQLLRSEAKLSILKFSLSVRSYSPKVIVFQNIIQDLLSFNQNSLVNCVDHFVELSLLSNKSSPLDRYVCGAEAIEKSINEYIELIQKNFDQKIDHPATYSIDHIYPSKFSCLQHSKPILTVILYTNIGSENFYRIHKLIRDKITSDSPLRYIVRHNPLISNEPTKVALSGYGVELAIKSTEYKAQDDTRVRGEVVQSDLIDDAEQQLPDEISGFIISKLKSRYPSATIKLDDFTNYLMDQEKEIATLKVWELQEISLQAVTKILSVQKEKALTVLKEMSQNFPIVARSLVKINVDNELRREIVRNQQIFYQTLNLATSDSALFVNGLYHDVDSIDIFSLLETVKSEFYTVSKLHWLLNGDQSRIKQLDSILNQQQKHEIQLDIRDAAVLYINDLEKDDLYRNWPYSLNEMLRPTYPGILRNLRRNLYHLVLVMNPSHKESFDMLRMAESFYVHKAPVRIGLVFDVNDADSVTGYTDASVACLEAFNYVAQTKNAFEALSFLTDVIAFVTSSEKVRNLESVDIIGQLKSKFKLETDDLDDIFGSESSFDTGRKLSADFLKRTGLYHGPKALLNGIMLKESHLNADYFEDAVLGEIMRQTSQLQKAIYKNELTDNDDVLEWLMSKKTVMPRINRLIFDLIDNYQQKSSSSKVIDLMSEKIIKQHSSSLDPTRLFESNVNDLLAELTSSLRYINSKKDCNPVTVWLVSDFHQEESRNILLSCLKHLRETSRAMRLSLIYADHNPITRLFESAFSVINSSSQSLNFLIKSIEHNDWNDMETIYEFASQEYRQSLRERYSLLNDSNHSPFPLHQVLASKLFSISSHSNEMILVLNSRIIRLPLKREKNSSQVINEDDFALMERFVKNFFTDKILSLLEESVKTMGTRKCSDLILRLCSVLSGKTSTSKQRYDISSNIYEEHSVLTLEPKSLEDPFIEMIAILDPLTRGAQKISPILENFYQVFNCKIRIYFNAMDKHSDMPLKSFYRFVLDRELKFDSSGRIISPSALFKSMPTTPLFTLGMSVPENWMVEAIEAIHDLDNIHLAKVSSNIVAAVFELEHLLVEGHCFEQSSGNPPRGLQFTLGTKTDPTKYDTIVMANLGYFQLKASPGIWTLKLRHGRSDDIYTIVSDEDSEQGPNGTEVFPIISSFRSLVLKIRVNKKPGKQHEELLYDSDDLSKENEGWFASWTSDLNKSMSHSSKSIDSEDDEDSKRINIFSLASGHLYERLLRIMMLSVLKNTKTAVKFWFLKNYLSPHFKQVLPKMAIKYNFQYELVQYKWPRWLHQQTEKQRIIWGYKILFLDVLFPLNVKKIIFVDADQVVRADLKELRDFDLEGAPYGYTPFCDSRKDMDGFRFWKSGYWATHLHGRKYHISALYVIDLQKFRRIAAGDRLRGQYQGLSQDPNSLSNLDQDLPNNMIHQVRFILPRKKNHH